MLGVSTKRLLYTSFSNAASTHLHHRHQFLQLPEFLFGSLQTVNFLCIFSITP